MLKVITEIEETIEPEVHFVVGVSGSGKTTLVDTLIADHPDDVTILQSITTRAPRGDSSDAYYQFLSQEAFDTALAKGELIEHVTNYGKSYGISKNIEDQISTGLEAGITHFMLIATYEGVEPVKEFLDSIGVTSNVIFIRIDSDTQNRRLEHRGDADSSKRLAAFIVEDATKSNCDFIIPNLDNCFKQAYNSFQAITLYGNMCKV